MHLIRQNIFLACTIGVVIVVGGALVAYAYTQNAAYDADLALVKKVSEDLQSAGNRGVSEKELTRLRDNSNRRLRQKEGVLRKSVEWNKRHYRVLRLPGEGAAFPYDRKRYGQKGLIFKFTREYVSEMSRLIESLNSTVPPSELAVKREMKKWADRMEQEYTAASVKVDKLSGVDTRKEIKTDRTFVGVAAAKFNQAPIVRKKRPEGVTDREWQLANMDVKAREAEVQRKAWNSLIVRHANAGSIYAGEGALTMVFTEAEVLDQKAPPTKLWAAQRNLWVNGDIVAAIAKTNVDSVATGDGKSVEKTVPNVAIKDLLSAKVEENYVMGGSSTSASATARPTRFGGGFRYAGMPRAHGGYRPPSRGASPRGGTTTKTEKAVAKTLSQRATTTEHEVVEYSFEVIMNTRYLLALMHNLETRGDHIINKVEVNKVTAQDREGKYFGTAPVSRVTISGDLLMKADWTRGVWDVPDRMDSGGKKSAWRPRALMPAEVLSESLKGVLRVGDKRRIKD